ncbi:hypothetical protein HGRIS_003691 [Hohenbuehelia grisea]|uniref:chitinase n=1 Tax=Hohenbuehelia grisea TaxID=104357 RepID=A0ABR3JH63_9AGAR
MQIPLSLSYLLPFFRPEVIPQASFNISRPDNVAAYWGQNSYGNAFPGQPSKWQQTLDSYCQDDSIDIIPIAFLTQFTTPPSINLANSCTGPYFPGTQLLNCAFMATQIKKCQSKGKTILLSLGGATGGPAFKNDADAKKFADQIWNLFLGGTSKTRPFGSAVLDGVDLDIEAGSPTGLGAFVNQIRSRAKGQKKKYFVTAAPQCVYPDFYLGKALDTVSFDAVFVQFYNNPCGLDQYGKSGWNFERWDRWARTTSINKKVKIFIGAPASSTSAGRGYVNATRLATIAKETRKKYPSFGGIMLWDVSQAVANKQFNVVIKKALKKN